MTTLRRDGMPIAMPLWFAAIGRQIYLHTRGKKLQRLAHDPRASFLVEAGDAWEDLRAVHFTGTAAPVESSADVLAQVEAETARKYDAFRYTEMPAAAAEHYASTMRWVRFTPDTRFAVYGTTADARDRIAGRKRLPQLRFHSPPSFMVSPKRVAAYSRSIIDLLR